MKLVDPEHQPIPHLPDAEEDVPRYLQWAKSLIEFVTSAKGVTMGFGLLTVLVLSFILSFDHLAVFKIVSNGVSKQDIFAPFTFEVVDEVETNRRIALAQQALPPVYRPEEPINNAVRENLIKLLNAIDDLSADTGMPETEKRRTFGLLISDLDEEPANADRYYQLLVKKYTPEHRDKLRQLSKETTERILRNGLTSADFFERKNELIDQAMPSGGYSREEGRLVKFLVGAKIQPNRVVDDQKTLKARKDAADQVVPVTKTFRKGQKIVTRGEYVTQLQLKALEKLGKSVKGINWSACLGIILFVGFFISILWGYLYFYEERKYFTPAYASMLAFMSSLVFPFVKILADNQAVYSFPFLSIYAFPMAAYALTISIFIHPRAGVLATLLMTFLMGLTMNVQFQELAVLLFGSMVGVFILSRRVNFTERNHWMIACFYIGITNIFVITAIHLLGEMTPTTGVKTFWESLLYDWSAGALGGFLSGMIAIGLLPFLESMFHLVTPYTLMELSNHDKPLLKRMQFEAPGTFHHSLMVASLSEAAAEAIGANPLLTRVGCLYHDIGKMKRPQFFIENQAYLGIENPHDKLTPRLSKMVITAHPRDSLELAKQYKLPKVLTKFMTEHHGTLVAGYFYNKACQEEGAENVNKSQFRYPGPKPNIKETAIVMMADACESAVRAMKNPSVGQIEERIDKIIQQRVDDGQFDNCPLTFRDISTIRETFVRVLRGIQHNRIEYQQTMMQELGRKFPAAQQLSSGTPESRPEGRNTTSSPALDALEKIAKHEHDYHPHHGSQTD